MTIPDGAIDWAVGDIVTITISGTGKYAELDPSAVNGSEVATAFFYAPVDASLADAPCVVLYWAADVNAGKITWPAGITDTEKATAIAQLAEHKLRIQ